MTNPTDPRLDSFDDRQNKFDDRGNVADARADNAEGRQDKAADRAEVSEKRADTSERRADTSEVRANASDARADASEARADALGEKVQNLSDNADARQTRLAGKVDALASGVLNLADNVEQLGSAVSVEKTWRKRHTIALFIVAAAFTIFSILSLVVLTEVLEIGKYNKSCNTIGSACFEARTDRFVDVVADDVGDRIGEEAIGLLYAFEVAGCVDVNQDGLLGDPDKPFPATTCVPIRAE